MVFQARAQPTLNLGAGRSLICSDTNRDRVSEAGERRPPTTGEKACLLVYFSTCSWAQLMSAVTRGPGHRRHTHSPALSPPPIPVATASCYEEGDGDPSPRRVREQALPSVQAAPTRPSAPHTPQAYSRPVPSRLFLN